MQHSLPGNRYNGMMNDGGSTQRHTHPVLPEDVGSKGGETRAVSLTIVVTLAIANLVVSRLVWGEIPLQTDTGIWAYFGGRMLDGAKLYRDLWESKPPGIFWTFEAVERVFGARRDLPFLWLDAVVTVAVCAVTYLVAKRVASRGAALIAACVLSVVLTHRVLADWGDNLEKFVALFEMMACWLIVRSPAGRDSAARWLGVGLCCGLAAMFKQTGVLLLVILLVGLTVGWRAIGVSRRWRAMVCVLVGAALPWAIVLTWLIANNAAGDFWRQVVVHDLFRAASPELERSRLFEPEHWASVGRHLLLGFILFGPALAGCLIWAGGTPQRGETADKLRGAIPPVIGLFVVYAGMATLIFVFAPHGYGHYLLHPAPAAAVLFAWVMSLDVTFGERPIRGLIVIVGICVGVWQLGDHFEFVLQPRCDARRAYEHIKIGRAHV